MVQKVEKSFVDLQVSRSELIQSITTSLKTNMQRTVFITTVFVTKDFAVNSNLLS